MSDYQVRLFRPDKRARNVYLSRPGVVIDEEYPAVSVNSFLPPFWQGTEVVFMLAVGHIVDAGQGRRPACPWVHPGRPFVTVVDEKHTAVGSNLEAPSRW